MKLLDPIYTIPLTPMDGDASTAEPVLYDQPKVPVLPTSAYTYPSLLPKYKDPVTPL